LADLPGGVAEAGEESVGDGVARLRIVSHIVARASAARGRASVVTGTPSAESSNAAFTPWAYQVGTG
jgi:hypothetical protein